MIKKIPKNAIEIQTGLWVYRYVKVIGKIAYTFTKLYASEGYCFYDINEEIYDKDGNLISQEDIKLEQRHLSEYAMLSQEYSYLTYEELNKIFVSVVNNNLI